MIRIRMEALNARCCVRVRARASRGRWCVRVRARASRGPWCFGAGVSRCVTLQNAPASRCDIMWAYLQLVLTCHKPCGCVRDDCVRRALTASLTDEHHSHTVSVDYGRYCLYAKCVLLY